MAILDADKEGFLRSDKSLIQTIGRAARNVSGQVVMYADKVTAVDGEGDRRDQPAPREAGRLQQGARASTRSRCARRSPTSPRCWPARTRTPRSCSAAAAASSRRGKAPVPGPVRPRTSAGTPPSWPGMPSTDLAELVQQLTDQMHAPAAELQFEVAARLRDEISGPQEGAAPDGRGRGPLTVDAGGAAAATAWPSPAPGPTSPGRATRSPRSATTGGGKIFAFLGDGRRSASRPAPPATRPTSGWPATPTTRR